MQKFIKDHVPSGSGSLGVIAILTILVTAAVLSGCSRIPGGAGDSSDTVQTVILYGNDDPEDLEILKHRLSLFAGEGKYTLEKGDGFFTLVLPGSLCRNDRYLESCLEQFLTTPCKMSIVRSDPNGCPYLEGRLTVAQLTPGDCHDMKIETLSVENEMSRGDDLMTLDMDTPPCRRLVLEFSRETADRIKDLTKTGCNVYLSDNNIYKDYETGKNIPQLWALQESADDPCSFWIEYNETDGLYGNEELFYYNLTHDALSRPYNYCIADGIIWDDPEQNTSSGSNQCREDALQDSYMFFQLSSYQKMSSDERSRMLLLLLRRLDLLQSPYAYGQTADGSICVRLGSSRIDRAVLTLLTACNRSPLYLKVQGNPEMICPEFVHIRYDDKASLYEVSLPAKAASELDETVSNQMKSSKGAKVPFQAIPVYLCVDTIPIARCTTGVFFNPSVLTFNEIYLPDTGEDTSWFFTLVQEAANTYQINVPAVEIDYLYSREGGKDLFNASADFPLQEQPLISVSEIEQNVKAILPQAQIRLSSDMNTLNIYMNLPADEKLISQIFSLTPQIVDASNYKKEYFDNLSIFPVETAGDERCSLTFSRRNDGSISFTGVMYNGRLSSYKDDLQDAVSKDTYFNSMITDEYSGWFW